MRYQRHVDNYHLHHAKEVVEMLDRVVREGAAEQVRTHQEIAKKPGLSPRQLLERKLSQRTVVNP